MEEKPPRVSVIMPVYNGEKTLGLAVESVLQQTYRDLELICVDDGSTDESPALLRTFAERDRRMIVICRPNTGIVGAMNDGLAVARGEYIARMDHDDYSLPQRLERQVEFMDAQPDVVCSGSRALRVDPDGDPIEVWRVPLTHEEIDAHHIVRGSGGGIIHPAAMFRREAMTRLGGYQASAELAEDLDLWLRFAETGRLANLEEILLYYRVSQSGLSLSRREAQAKRAHEVVNAARRRRTMPPAPPEEPWVPSQEYQLRSNIIAAKAEGYWRTARKYAFRLLRQRPVSKLAWLVLFQSTICLALGLGNQKPLSWKLRQALS